MKIFTLALALLAVCVLVAPASACGYAVQAVVATPVAVVQPVVVSPVAVVAQPVVAVQTFAVVQPAFAVVSPVVAVQNVVVREKVVVNKVVQQRANVRVNVRVR